MSKVYLLLVVVFGTCLPSTSSLAQSGVRLFLTPEIRLELERRRLGIIEAVPEPKASLVEAITDLVSREPKPDVIYALGGTMLKSDGSSTVWINGSAIDEKDLPNGVRLEKPASMGKLIVRANGEDLVIKPGQVLNATTGVIYEAYQWQQQLEMKRLEELRAENPARSEQLTSSNSAETQ